MDLNRQTPIDRARAKIEELERELRKSPDFQLYLIAKTRQYRARMKRMLMHIPIFKLWLMLRNCAAPPKPPVPRQLQPSSRAVDHVSKLNNFSTASVNS